MLLSLKFRVDGPDCGKNIAYPKHSRGKFGHGEDSLATTPFAVVVSDGVGGCKFTSKHWSELFVYQYQDFVQETFIKSKFNWDGDDANDQAVKLAFKNFEQLRTLYNTALKSTRDAWNQKHGLNRPVISDDTLISATLIGAFIDPQEEEVMRVLQTGDSLLATFMPQHNDDETKLYYFPHFMTDEMRRGWNFPFQYANIEQKVEKNDPETVKEKFEFVGTWVRVGTVVLLGSDGLWDNLHLTSMTALLNALVHYHTHYGNDKGKVWAAADRFMTAIVKVLLHQFELIKHDLSYLGFNNQAMLEKRVQDPDYVAPEKSLFDYLLCRDVDEPQQITIKESYDRLVAKTVKSLQGSPAFKQEAGFINEIHRCGMELFVVMPWHSGRTHHMMKGCIEEAIKDHLAVTPGQLGGFQKGFDSAFVSEVFAKVAKFYSQIDKNYASPFYLTAVEDKNNINYQSDGKPDDITAIAVIIDAHGPGDLTAHETDLKHFKEVRTTVLATLETELTKYYDILEKAYRRIIL